MTQELRNLALDLRFAGRYATETEAEAALRRIKRNQEASFAMESLLDRVEKAEKDARRYQVLRNPPYSDNWGDVYAMTFQRTGDMPLKGEELDVAVDRLIYAAMEASK